MVSGYQYLTLTWETQVQSPLQAKTFFYFFLLFPGLSQIFTKKQSWNSRYADFFQMNIKILTTRVLKKWSELKKVTWKIVQLNLKSNSILLISQLLNYRFSKVRPFLESMELAKFRAISKKVVPGSVFSQFWKKDWSWNFCENRKNWVSQ